MRTKKIIAVIISVLYFFSLFLYFFLQLINSGNLVHRKILINGIDIDRLFLVITFITCIFAFVITYIDARKYRHNIHERRMYMSLLLDSIFLLIYGVCSLWLAIQKYYHINSYFLSVATLMFIVLSTIIIYIIKKIINKNGHDDICG